MYRGLFLAVMAVVLAGPAVGENEGGITGAVAQAVEDGTIKLSFRYRFEFVDEDEFSNDAYANTLKSRLTFAPNFGDDWGVVLEFDDVRHIGSSKFNDTRNNNTNRPSVLDPEGTDLNQALVRYTGFDNVTLGLGRQRINRGNQRFIGGVGWRQNEQTYDSFLAAYGDEGAFQAFYSYVFQVNRIFGPDSGTPPEDLDSDIHLLDLKYKFSDALKLSGYGYYMDFDDADALSNLTVGFRADGQLPLREDLRFSYIGEYAYQEDEGDNPVSYDADYYLLQAGVGFSVLDFAAGYEVLGGNNEADAAFRTPLATLHKFQGWADRFAGVTGSGSLDSGIEDFYISASAKFLKGKFTIVYHDFEGETGGGSLGEEWDASASWKFGDHYGLLLKLASYDADEFPANEADVFKFWAQFTAAF